MDTHTGPLNVVKVKAEYKNGFAFWALALSITGFLDGVSKYEDTSAETRLTMLPGRWKYSN